MKKTTKFICALALLVSLTACGSGSSGNANSGTANGAAASANAAQLQQNGPTYNLVVDQVINPSTRVFAASVDTLATALPTTNLRAIAKGNGLYVVVGDSGTIITSKDGKTWSSINTGITVNFHDVTFSTDKKLFYVVGDNGKVLTSSDGITWTSYVPLTPSTNLFSVASGQGRIVIGSQTSLVFEITKGVRGDQVTSRNVLNGSNINIVSIINANGLFLVGGDDGSLIYKLSNDNWASNPWNRAAQSAGNPIAGLAYDSIGNQFIAATANAKVLSSEPGTSNWSVATPVSSDSTSSLSAIYVDPVSTQFYVVGSTANNSLISSSMNFNYWTPYATSFSNKLNSMKCFDTQDCFIVGNSGTILSGLSRDGNNNPIWKQVTSDVTLLASGTSINNANGTQDVILLKNEQKTFILQKDSNLVCYGAGSGALWASTTNTNVYAAAGSATMQASGYLHAVGSYTSKDIGQLSNGAYLIYRPSDNSVDIVAADGITIIKKLC